jgi:hypothetical protein
MLTPAKDAVPRPSGKNCRPVAPKGRRSRLKPSDPADGEELGVVALIVLGPGDLLGRVELREVDDLDVVAGPIERVLV